jgi:hypothetical protein
MVSYFVEWEIGNSRGRLLEYEQIPFDLFLKIKSNNTDLLNTPFSRFGSGTVGRYFTKLSPFEEKFYKTTQDTLRLSFDGECVKCC